MLFRLVDSIGVINLLNLSTSHCLSSMVLKSEIVARIIENFCHFFLQFLSFFFC